MRSESQAIAARLSGSSSATAANTISPSGADGPTTGKNAIARSAAKRTASATTSWRRLNRHPRRIPTPKMTHEYTGAEVATASRIDADCKITVTPSSSTAPGAR